MGNIFFKQCDKNPTEENHYFCRNSKTSTNSGKYDGNCIGGNSVIWKLREPNGWDQDQGRSFDETDADGNTIIGKQLICQDNYIVEKNSCKSESEGDTTGCKCIPDPKICGRLKVLPTVVTVLLVVVIIFLIINRRRNEYDL